jgi:hypothetical protein
MDWLWTTAELIPLIEDNRVAPPEGFWIGRYATRVVLSESQEIYFDQLPVWDKRMAPFVAPNVQGTVMRRRGQDMGKFAPAYVKPKHVVDPSQAVPRMPGEPFGQPLTLAQRRDRIVAENMRQEREFCERRFDWMACSAICNGYVDVSGDKYPTVRVDFKRDASLTGVIGAGLRWNEGGALPLEDINTMRLRSFALGRSSTNDIIFGIDAWAAFSKRPEVLALLNVQNRGSNSNFNGTGLRSGEPFEYQGRISGPNGGGFIDMWTYSNDYEDENGVMQQYLDPRDVVGVGGNVQGIMCFGAIMDHEALQPARLFPKMWKEEDPSVVYTMTQSAPLFVPGVPNNTWKIRVLA